LLEGKDDAKERMVAGLIEGAADGAEKKTFKCWVGAWYMQKRHRITSDPRRRKGDKNLYYVP